MFAILQSRKGRCILPRTGGLNPKAGRSIIPCPHDRKRGTTWTNDKGCWGPLIGAGIDFKTAQDILGHASAATAIDLYAHALDENKRMAINVFASLSSDSESTPQNKVIPLRKAAN
jgi:integrase